MKVDAVQHDVEVSVVGLDFWILRRRHRIFDRQWMKSKAVAQDEIFRLGRRSEVDPEQDARIGAEPGAFEAADFLGLTVAMNEDSQHCATGPEVRGWRSEFR